MKPEYAKLLKALMSTWHDELDATSGPSLSIQRSRDDWGSQDSWL